MWRRTMWEKHTRSRGRPWPPPSTPSPSYGNPVTEHRNPATTGAASPSLLLVPVMKQPCSSSAWLNTITCVIPRSMLSAGSVFPLLWDWGIIWTQHVNREVNLLNHTHLEKQTFSYLYWREPRRYVWFRDLPPEISAATKAGLLNPNRLPKV